MRITDFKAQETIFYYRINGRLCQMVNVTLETEGFDETEAVVTITAEAFGTESTTVRIDCDHIGPYAVYAPVIYPNIIHGACQPVTARISISTYSQKIKGQFILGLHRPWTIYMLTDDAADYVWGYTVEQHKKNTKNLLDAHINWIEKTSHFPAEIQNRFNINETMEIERFLELSKDDRIQKLFKYILDGHMQISPVYSSSCTAITNTEQLIRVLYYGRRLENAYGVDIKVAQVMEIPTITWGLASILANAGVKYLIRGWLNFYTPYNKDRDQYPFFKWEGPDGKSVVVVSDTNACMKSSYAHGRFFITETYDKILDELHNWWIPNFENNSHYPFDALPLIGAYWDLLDITSAHVATLVNNTDRYHNELWEYPKVVNATWNQYFNHIEDWLEKNEFSLPVLKGDYGCSWEEWPLHVAHILAMMRNNINRYISVETLASMAMVQYPRMKKDIDEDMKKILLNMQEVSEHQWNGSFKSETAEAVVRKLAWCSAIASYTDNIMSKAAENLFGRGELPIERQFAMVNSLSWDVNRAVEIKVSEKTDVFDMKLSKKLASSYCQKSGTLNFVTEELPAMGYRIFRLESGNWNPYVHRSEDETTFIENENYRIEINTGNGSIKHLYDKKNNIELVNTSNKYGLNQYVYLSEDTEYTFENVRPILDKSKIYKVKVSYGYGGGFETIYNYTDNVEFLNCKGKYQQNHKVTLTENTEYTLKNVKIHIEDKSPVCKTIVIYGETFRTKVETRITLYNRLDRIDIENRLEKLPSTEPYEIHFIFPFAVPEGKCHYDGPGSIIRPEEVTAGGDHLSGSGRQMYAVQSFVDISNNNYGVTFSQIDSTMIQFGHRTTREYPVDSKITDHTILSLVMLNKHHEMIQDQAGNSTFLFRYSILSHQGGFIPYKCLKFGMEQNIKSICIPINNIRETPSAIYERQYIKLDREDIIVSAFKPAELEDGNLILRLRDAGGIGGAVTIDLSVVNPDEAYITDLLERDIEVVEILKGCVKIDIKPYSFTSVRLVLKDTKQTVQFGTAGHNNAIV